MGGPLEPTGLRSAWTAKRRCCFLSSHTTKPFNSPPQKGSSLGCGGASPSSCLSFSVAM